MITEPVRRVRVVVAVRAVRRRLVAVRKKLNRARKRAGGLGGSKLVHSADWLAPGDYVLRPHLRDKIRPVIH